MSAPQRTLSRCMVCGFAEVRTDEVIDRGTVLLAECVRCNHRWTARNGGDESSRLRRIPMEAEGAAAA